MTSVETLIARIPVRSLPIPFDGDLVIDFRNRDPILEDVYIDFPVDVTAVLTIYTDVKTTGATRITVDVTPSGSHCVVKLDSTVIETVKKGTPWSFKLIYPDPDMTDGYGKVVVNGLTIADDGKTA